MKKEQTADPAKDIARKVFMLLASESSDETLPLCRQIADLEESKQRASARFRAGSALLNAEYSRLVTLQQGLLLRLLKGKEQMYGQEKEKQHDLYIE